MYLACSTLVCRKDDYPEIGEVLRTIRELGFSRVDLAAFENWQNVNPSELAMGLEDWEDELVRTVKAEGLAVCSLNCGMSVQIPEADDRAWSQYRREFEALLALAQRLDCPNLTVQPGKSDPAEPDDVRLARVVDRLGELGDRAGGCGVSLGVEAHQGSLMEDPAVALAAMEQLAGRAGLTYDPSHFVMQDIPLGQTQPLLAHAVHVHVRDAAPGEMQAAFGGGLVDVGWLVPALGSIGYQGAVSIEYFNGFDGTFTSVRALRDRLTSLGVRR